MQVWRVSYTDKTGKSLGFDFFGGEFVANAAVKKAKSSKRLAKVQSYDVPLTRKGILDALNQFGGHADNA